ncbi:MAG: Stk1 family PASTA domain-containing Ser/Thr kinase [Actinobacteria bacterium]|nr:Stk1 family PASTA domain-containing Ser/Thr kinase [Actinomycetota bacterium]
MAVSDTLINTLFDGRYKIIRKLGSGGMANVYLAEDQELGRRVAIKILNERHANDDQFVERFRREAKNAAGLSHPNIVSIYDRGEAEGTYYIAMEYLDGRSLKELIVGRGPAPVHVAIDYARKILDALRFAHRNGIVHRDIKPHNVIVDAEGRVKVTDFGIARAGTSQMTEVGSIIGTAQYLSPEQAKGAPVDQTSDLYSVGIVLYELLTGKVPFSGDSPVEIAMKHISAIPEPPSSLRPDVPEDLDLIVLRALGKTPEERYPSAEEMDKDLGRVAQGLGVSRETEEAATQVLSRSQLTPAGTIAPPRPPAEVLYEYEQPRRGRPGWPWLLVLLLVLAAALTGWFVYQQVRDQLADAGTVGVPYLIDLRETQAVGQVLDEGLEPNVIREANADVEAGFVFEQDPAFGAKVDPGSTVDIKVSTGPPQTEVPDVIGQSRDEAVAALARADLEPKIVEVFSEKEPGTVTGQNPAAGEQVKVGTRVQINVSRGVRPLDIPSVIGQPYESAASALQGAGFRVARRNVDSTEPAGTVVDQQPEGGGTAPAGTTVTLSVSKGPVEQPVPDVTNQAEGDAVATLEASGFTANVVREATEDPNLDGFVIRQDPAGGRRAPQGSAVTIVVAQFTP